eukprot:1659964-Ditylum_brightwellii.AAC.1
MKGMCVRLTTTINTLGQVTNLYLTVKGLKTKELPIHDNNEDRKAGVVVKETPGFAMSRVFDL